MISMIGSQFTGASMHPLLMDWMTWLRDQQYTWANEFRILGGRALSLACNDPFVAALAQAHVLGTLGPIGLRMSSLYDEGEAEESTSDHARQIRRQINALCGGTWYGRELDAEGMRSRMDLETALCWSAFVIGEGIAVRVWRNGRSKWRLIDPQRVCNPDGKPNDDRMRDGIQLDGNGVALGMWINTGIVGPFGVRVDEHPTFIPWNAADGTPNIIHRTGFRLPGMFRGVSRIAPMVIMSRQLNGVLESHVAAKRLQAIYGMIVEADSPEEYEAAQASGDALDPTSFNVKGPLSVWVKKPGQTVQFPDVKFNGADLRDYLTIMYKVQAASVQMPVDVVLCQMGEASLSSARAGLDQFDRTCQGEQEKHINECSSIMDRVEVSDAIVSGSLVIAATDWPHIMAAKYQRPPKYSTDRLKDANTILALRQAGMSGSTAFGLFGWNYEDEREMAAAEAAFNKSQGIIDPGAGISPEPAAPANEDDTAPVDQAEPADNADDALEKPAPSSAEWRKAMARLRERFAA